MTANVSAYSDVRSIDITSGAHQYPLLCMLSIGGPFNYPAAWSAKAAGYHLVVKGGWGDAAAAGYDTDNETAVSTAMSASSIGTEIFQYVNPIEMNEADPLNAAWKAKCDAANWYLYQLGTSGAKAKSTWNTAWSVVNPSHHVAQSEGMWPYEWFATLMKQILHDGSDARAAPSLTGYWTDNGWHQPRVSTAFDLNRVAPSDTKEDPAIRQALRTGMNDFAIKLRELLPTKLVGINSDWGPMANAPNFDDPTTVAPLNGQWNFAFGETYLGESYSVETFSANPTLTLLGRLKWFNLVLRDPARFAYGHTTITSTGTDRYDTTPYRAMRYGLAVGCLGGAYYTPTASTAYSSDPALHYTFDEYVGGSLNTRGWLGDPIDDPQYTARAGLPANVCAREFDNGLVLLVAKGAGQVTISMANLTAAGLGGSGTWRRLSGTQAPTVNTGALVTSNIVLGGTSNPSGRDALFLRRA